jgi:hypothetical protein
MVDQRTRVEGVRISRCLARFIHKIINRGYFRPRIHHGDIFVEFLEHFKFGMFWNLRRDTDDAGTKLYGREECDYERSFKSESLYLRRHLKTNRMEHG